MDSSANASAPAGGNVVQLYTMDAWGSREPGSGFPKPRRVEVVDESPPDLPLIGDLEAVRRHRFLQTALAVQVDLKARSVTFLLDGTPRDMPRWVQFLREEVVLLERDAWGNVWTYTVISVTHPDGAVPTVSLGLSVRHGLPPSQAEDLTYACGGDNVPFPAKGHVILITKGPKTTTTPSFPTS